MVAAGLSLSGCAGITTVDGQKMRMSSPQFRAYVEQVFRHQNQVATALLFAMEEAQGEEARARLALLEDSLLSACAGLNELATARRDGARLGVFREAGLARETPMCEAMTMQAERALQRPDRE